MAKILENSPEENALVELVVKIGDILQMDEEDEVLIGILIDTTEKLEAFQKWIEENMDGDKLTVSDKRVMHQVAVISRMY